MIQKSLKKYRVWGKITAALFVLMMLALIILAKGKEPPDVCLWITALFMLSFMLWRYYKLKFLGRSGLWLIFPITTFFLSDLSHIKEGSYEWRCHACDVLNLPGASFCVTCACPASASAHEINKFKSKIAKQA